MSAESDFEDAVKICEFYADRYDEYFQRVFAWKELV